jgi:hypothetical protein
MKIRKGLLSTSDFLAHLKLMTLLFSAVYQRNILIDYKSNYLTSLVFVSMGGLK